MSHNDEYHQLDGAVVQLDSGAYLRLRFTGSASISLLLDTPDCCEMPADASSYQPPACTAYVPKECVTVAYSLDNLETVVRTVSGME